MVVGSGSATLERKDRAPQVNWQLELAPRELALPWPRLRQLRLPVSPIAGIMATSQGALYVYGGGRVDRQLGDSRWLLSPSFSAGLYHASKGKRLGGVLEFRTGLELSLRVADNVQLGVVLYHLSNGHLYHNNPGTESLLFTYRAGLR